MQSYSITDVKSFMSQLFVKDFFDSFAFVEASVKTSISYHIDGHINKDFFDTDEEAGLQTLCLWKNARTQLFHMIKGRRLPLSMKIVLKVPDDKIKLLLAEMNSFIKMEDFEGCYLNIIYKQPELSCTTGVSLHTFTMDKTFEHYFDEYMGKFLKEWL